MELKVCSLRAQKKLAKTRGRGEKSSSLKVHLGFLGCVMKFKGLKCVKNNAKNMRD